MYMSQQRIETCKLSQELFVAIYMLLISIENVHYSSCFIHIILPLLTQFIYVY